jgi:hypothetical protein
VLAGPRAAHAGLACRRRHRYAQGLRRVGDVCSRRCGGTVRGCAYSRSGWRRAAANLPTDIDALHQIILAQLPRQRRVKRSSRLPRPASRRRRWRSRSTSCRSRDAHAVRALIGEDRANSLSSSSRNWKRECQPRQVIHPPRRASRHHRRISHCRIGRSPNPGRCPLIFHLPTTCMSQAAPARCAAARCARSARMSVNGPRNLVTCGHAIFPTWRDGDQPFW